MDTVQKWTSKQLIKIKNWRGFSTYISTTSRTTFVKHFERFFNFCQSNVFRSSNEKIWNSWTHLEFCSLWVHKLEKKTGLISLITLVWVLPESQLISDGRIRQRSHHRLTFEHNCVIFSLLWISRPWKYQHLNNATITKSNLLWMKNEKSAEHTHRRCLFVYLLLQVHTKWIELLSFKSIVFLAQCRIFEKCIQNFSSVLCSFWLLQN